MDHRAGRGRLCNDEGVDIRGPRGNTAKGDEVGRRWGRTDGEDEAAEVTRRLSDNRDARFAIVARVRAEERQREAGPSADDERLAVVRDAMKERALS